MGRQAIPFAWRPSPRFQGMHSLLRGRSIALSAAMDRPDCGRLPQRVACESPGRGDFGTFWA
jgi:hypothetical protein